ncbi:MAG: amino acid ABC transporter substrate-binding protein [Oceanospirillaceae bacterium]
MHFLHVSLLSKWSVKLINVLVLLLLSSSHVWAEPTIQGKTLKSVRDRGYLICGVGTNDIGFATQDKQGLWVGFDVDFCRAIAAAVLNNDQAIKFIPLDSQNRFRALQQGNIDVLIRTTTWTLSRDTNMQLDFAGVTLFDEQGILVHNHISGDSLQNMDGLSVCANIGTTSLDNLMAHISSNKLNINVLKLATQEGRWRAFFNRECDAITADKSDLLAKLSTFTKAKNKYRVLDEYIAKEPLGPVVRDDDRQWFDIVKWVIYAIILAEEKNITSIDLANKIKKFDAPASPNLGLDLQWPEYVIKSVGNYAQIYERNLGAHSSIKIKRGINSLWTDGGLLYAMPFK